MSGYCSTCGETGGCDCNAMPPPTLKAIVTRREILLATVERLVNACEGLAMGEDWNNGTMAKQHGYREQLLDALPAARAAMNELIEGPSPNPEASEIMREALEKIGSGEAFREQRFAEDDDSEYFLRAQRKARLIARKALSSICRGEK